MGWRGRHNFSKGIYIVEIGTKIEGRMLGFEGKKWDVCNVAYGEVAVTCNNQDKRERPCVSEFRERKVSLWSRALRGQNVKGTIFLDAEFINTCSSNL